MLPTFLAKAQEDDAIRRALARTGYRRVRTAYLSQKKRAAGSDTFLGLAQEGLSPSLELVGEWLKVEKKRIRAHVRSTFLVAMVSAISGGLAFAAGMTLFR